MLLYILLGGHPPFEHEHEDQLFKLIRKGKYTFDKESWEGVSDTAKVCDAWHGTALARKFNTLVPVLCYCSLGAAPKPQVTRARDNFLPKMNALSTAHHRLGAAFA